MNVPAGNTYLSIVGAQKVASPGAVKTPKAMTGRVPAVADVLANWKCSVPETGGPAADDAPAGRASHKAPRRSWHVPTKAALFKARARLGPEPLKALFGAAAAALAPRTRRAPDTGNGG
jgi:hypothetical protein